MNKQSRLSPAADLGSPFPGSAATFTCRLADCSTCEGSGEVGYEWSDGFPDTRRCDDCNGSGETDAACVVCNRVVALDDDGYCRSCAGEEIIPVDARPIGGGIFRVEF